MFNSGNSTPFTMPVIPAGYSGGNGGSNGGFGGDGWGAWIWVILIFAIFGWGGNGWGNNGNGGGSNGGGVMDAYVLNSDFATLQRQIDSGFANTTAGINQVNQGLCNGFYQEAQLVNGVQMQIANEARTTDNAICNLGTAMQQGNFALQQAINADTVANMQNTNAIQGQLAQCCCDNKSAIAQVRYDMATQACDTRNTIQNTTRDIIDNNNANTRSILDFLVQDKISTLQTENQALRLAASQTAQNEYLVNQLRPCPVPAYITCNPYAASYGIGFNNGGCGCNSGCC